MHTYPRRPHEFFSSLLGEPCTTFDYKWLRAMYTGGFTGAHTDSVYMSRGTPNLYTLWTPIGDVDTQMGTIAVAEASNRSPGFQQLRDTYSAMDAEAEVGARLRLQPAGRVLMCRLPGGVGGWRLAVGGWRLAVGGWRLAVGGWRLAVGGWREGVSKPVHELVQTFQA